MQPQIRDYEYELKSLIKLNTTLELTKYEKRVSTITKYILDENESINHLTDYEIQGNKLIIKNPGDYNIVVITCKYWGEGLRNKEYTFHEIHYKPCKEYIFVKTGMPYASESMSKPSLNKIDIAQLHYTGSTFLTTTKKNTSIMLSDVIMNESTEVIVAVSRVGKLTRM